MSSWRKERYYTFILIFEAMKNPVTETYTAPSVI